MLTRSSLTIRLHPADDVVIARQQLVGGTTLIDENVTVSGLVPPGPRRPAGSTSGICAARLQMSPGSWQVPAGKRPGWSWLPPGGAMARPRGMPWWVRACYMTPLIDRYAFEWMWWHGGWAVPMTDGDPP